MINDARYRAVGRAKEGDFWRDRRATRKEGRCTARQSAFHYMPFSCCEYVVFSGDVIQKISADREKNPAAPHDKIVLSSLSMRRK